MKEYVCTIVYTLLIEIPEDNILFRLVNVFIVIVTLDQIGVKVLAKHFILMHLFIFNVGYSFNVAYINMKTWKGEMTKMWLNRGERSNTYLTHIAECR